MDILSQYFEQRRILEEKLHYILSLPYTNRNPVLVEMLFDEICDLDFAIAEMRKAYSDKFGYRPRRDTILTRADFYRSL